MKVENRDNLLEQLTGVNSSKLNYYVELKKRNEEVLKQNSRLEILHQLTRDINIDMSIDDILERTFQKLPQALPCDFLGLAQLRGDNLVMRSMMPKEFCRIDAIPRSSPLWRMIEDRRAGISNPGPDYESFVRHNPAYPARLRSMAAAPLFQRASVAGLLLVGSIRESAYAPAELNFVQHLADQLTISLQNARLYAQVSRAKKEWEATFRAVTDPVFLVDLDYNVLLHNDRLPPELNASWDRALSNKCFMRLNNRSRPCRNCPVEELKKTGKPVFSRWQSGTGLVFELSYYPVLNDEQQLAAVTIILKDVTQKNKMEAQLVHSAKLAALGEMAAGVAHELNSPMTVIIGTAQMLIRELREQGNGSGSEELNDIVNCGLRCKRIIQNLLTFSRQDQAPVTETDLNDEAKRVLSLIQYQINHNQIRVVENLDPDLPKLAVNGPQIQQVLTNFLVNARDALSETDRTEKVIEVITRQRRLNGERWLLLGVRDNGAGIARENLSKIFTPFYTSKETTKGTGLGLSVSLGIAESHGGTIEVQSRPGEGSTFMLVLPYDAQ